MRQEPLPGVPYTPEEYEKRIAELEAENQMLKEALDWIEAEPEDPHKVQQRAREALNNADTNPQEADNG